MSRLRRLAGTVRFRVTALATVVVLAVLAAASVGLVAAQDHLLTGNLDDSLRQRANDLAAFVAAGQPLPRLPAGDDDAIAQIVTTDGEVLAATSNVAGDPPIDEAPRRGTTETLRTVDELPVDDDAFRVLSRRIGGPDRPVVVHVAGELGDIEESIAALRTSLTVAVPVVVALLAALIWWLVGRTLRPVELIRAEVASITGGDLNRRVPEPAGDDEIARLARTMNAMLGRVEVAGERQRRFVADASHELRSPLTRIRSEIEVDLAHPDRVDAADFAATHRSVLEETTGLQRLVEDLLHLARSDAGAVVLRHEPVDLDDIVLEHARRVRAEGRVTVDSSGVGAAQVTGDPDRLSCAIANVVDNAARHATTTVTVSLHERDSEAVLTVADDGPGIPSDQHERIFERFTRLDDARSTASGGTGLGLAIARDVIEHHGGTITVDPNHQTGARFVMRLPVAPR